MITKENALSHLEAKNLTIVDSVGFGRPKISQKGYIREPIILINGYSLLYQTAPGISEFPAPSRDVTVQ